MDNEGIAFGDYLNFVGFADTIIVNCPFILEERMFLWIL